MPRVILGEINDNRGCQCEYTPNARGQIEVQAKLDTNFHEIGRRLKVHPDTVRYTIKQAPKRDTGHSLPRSGRPRKWDDRDKRTIIRYARISPKSTYQQMRDALQLILSNDTIFRILHSAGIKNWPKKDHIWVKKWSLYARLGPKNIKISRGISGKTLFGATNRRLNEVLEGAAFGSGVHPIRNGVKNPSQNRERGTPEIATTRLLSAFTPLLSPWIWHMRTCFDPQDCLTLHFQHVQTRGCARDCAEKRQHWASTHSNEALTSKPNNPHTNPTTKSASKFAHVDGETCPSTSPPIRTGRPQQIIRSIPRWIPPIYRTNRGLDMGQCFENSVLGVRIGNSRRQPPG